MTDTDKKFYRFIVSGILFSILICILIALSIAKSPSTLYDKLLYSINSHISDSNITKDIKQNTNLDYLANFIITEDKENYKYEISIKRTKVEVVK